MYWVVLSLLIVIENFFDFILSWVPFYSWFRLFAHLYLVMPGKGGATQFYLDQIEPFLGHHEAQIERFIGDAHERARSMGLKYAQDAIEWVKVNVLGMAPTPRSPARNQGAASYAQTLLSRFAMPSARPGASSGQPGDVYNLLSQALSGASALYGSRDAQAENLTASGTLIPRDIPPEDRPGYVNTQRDRLRTLLQAFDREAFFLGNDPARSSDDRLPKSRSEAEFDRIEVDEADANLGYGAAPNPPYPVTPAGGASWMPWKWGSPPPGDKRSDEYFDDRDHRDDGRHDRRDRDDRRYERDERRGKSSGFDLAY